MEKLWIHDNTKRFLCLQGCRPVGHERARAWSGRIKGRRIAWTSPTSAVVVLGFVLGFIGVVFVVPSRPM